ncbi:helix-turn-helix domain-containing protein [Streptomyces xanthochromogenes]|uniref:Helix-turn-helix domain-containing protein n=1 Tax=Streptomyces xanthochromogenes TaxID=67384 RepID=A0ABQ3AVT9_9ACTN|nr:hypothetical protein [Streptomyces xanthochromogenes]GGY65502.1 hypothetical protein GCM10010326_70120 [Streptomyces xanthochromogenes]
MSSAATDWVWDQSAATGNARTVLLAIARVANADGVAYAGTAMLMRRTRAARSTVRKSVDVLLASGELVVVEGISGPAGETVYRLPLVDGGAHVAPEEFRFRGAGDRPGSASGPGRESAPGGPETGREGGRGSALGGPETGPQNLSNRELQEAQQQPRASRSPLIPELHPLGDALAAAGVAVRWTLGLGEQRDAYRLVQAHGVEALVELAGRRTTPGSEAKSARYWLKVWSDLDRPASARPGPNVVPLRRANPAAYTDNLAAGLALLQAQKEGTAP